MGIRELKLKLENNQPVDLPIIFRLPDSKETFLPSMYIDAIASISNSDLISINNVNELADNSNFFEVANTPIYIYYTDKLEATVNLNNNIKLIIVAQKIPVEVETKYQNLIVNIPELEEWQLKEYASTKLQGVKDQTIESISNKYKTSPSKLKSEIEKISIFDESKRNSICRLLDIFPNYELFNLTTAIIQRNKIEVSKIMEHLTDINALGLLKILHDNFKNIIGIQLNPKATPQTLGINAKQFNAIKYNNLNFYNKQELIDVFQMLTEVDYKLKTGELPQENIKDYIITHIMGE